MFQSFFHAGFECACGYNVHGEWIDQVSATQHDLFADEDYRLITQLGIRVAREGILWPLVDRGSHYDFSSVRSRIEAARRHEVEVIWDLFHYGYPDDLDLFSPRFPERFADYCYAVARYVRSYSDGPVYFTPINEPSYYAWAAGDAGLFAPHQRGRSFELKVCLIRAAIAGIDAIRSVCREARIVNADPLCWVVAPADRPDLEEAASGFFYGAVCQSWDMLSGRLLPELGGSRKHLDLVGINYYWTNQWELTREGTPLGDFDPRRRPLGELIREVWQRYGGELLVTETSHAGDMRGPWLAEVADECERLLDDGVPLRGVCLYPILGMPEWHARDEWARMGLWDLVPQSPTLGRIPHPPTHAALREGQRLEGRQWGRPRRRVFARAA